MSCFFTDGVEVEELAPSLFRRAQLTRMIYNVPTPVGPDVVGRGCTAGFLARQDVQASSV